MMINKTVQDAINEQIKNELYSAYLYLSMAGYFESLTLPGFANWMKVQATEEQEHAMKFFNYVFERGGRVTLKAIDQPPFGNLHWRSLSRRWGTSRKSRV
jgi:ferritin